MQTLLSSKWNGPGELQLVHQLSSGPADSPGELQLVQHAPQIFQGHCLTLAILSSHPQAVFHKSSRAPGVVHGGLLRQRGPEGTAQGCRLGQQGVYLCLGLAGWWLLAGALGAVLQQQASNVRKAGAGWVACMASWLLRSFRAAGQSLHMP